MEIMKERVSVIRGNLRYRDVLEAEKIYFAAKAIGCTGRETSGVLYRMGINAGRDMEKSRRESLHARIKALSDELKAQQETNCDELKAQQETNCDELHTSEDN